MQYGKQSLQRQTVAFVCVLLCAKLEDSHGHSYSGLMPSRVYLEADETLLSKDLYWQYLLVVRQISNLSPISWVNIPRSCLWLLQLNKLVTTSVFYRSHQIFGRRRRVASNSILRSEVSPPDAAAFMWQSFQTFLLTLSGSFLASGLNPKYSQTGTLFFTVTSSAVVLSHLTHRHVSRLWHWCGSALPLCGADAVRL